MNVQWLEAPERTDEMTGNYKQKNNKKEFLSWKTRVSRLKREGKKNAIMPDTVNEKWTPLSHKMVKFQNIKDFLKGFI